MSKIYSNSCSIGITFKNIIDQHDVKDTHLIEYHKQHHRIVERCIKIDDFDLEISDEAFKRYIAMIKLDQHGTILEYTSPTVVGEGWIENNNDSELYKVEPAAFTGGVSDLYVNPAICRDYVNDSSLRDCIEYNDSILGMSVISSWGESFDFLVIHPERYANSNKTYVVFTLLTFEALD